jgi:hypothetical protein
LSVSDNLSVGGSTTLLNTTATNVTISGDVTFDGTQTGTQDFTISNDVRVTISSDEVTFDGTQIFMSNLPTSDPGNPGQLWNDAGTLKISL